MSTDTVQADEVFAFLTDALKSGTSPEVIQGELDASLRFHKRMTYAHGNPVLTRPGPTPHERKVYYASQVEVDEILASASPVTIIDGNGVTERPLTVEPAPAVIVHGEFASLLPESEAPNAE